MGTKSWLSALLPSMRSELAGSTHTGDGSRHEVTMDDHPKAQGHPSGLPDAVPLCQSADEVEYTSAPAAKSVKLNTELHAQLLRSGKVRPSTFESAMAALERLRRTRAG